MVVFPIVFTTIIKLKCLLAQNSQITSLYIRRNKPKFAMAVFLHSGRPLTQLIKYSSFLSSIPPFSSL